MLQGERFGSPHPPELLPECLNRRNKLMEALFQMDH